MVGGATGWSGQSAHGPVGVECRAACASATTQCKALEGCACPISCVCGFYKTCNTLGPRLSAIYCASILFEQLSKLVDICICLHFAPHKHSCDLSIGTGEPQVNFIGIWHVSLCSPILKLVT